MPPVACEITWLDHCGLPCEGVWVDIASIKPEPTVCTTVGFVVAETEAAIVVSHTADAEECASPFLILRSAILEIRQLKIGRRKRAGKG